MPLSSDPKARERQLANLKPQAPLRHGAYSAERLKPVREAILCELLASFPNVRRDRLELLAQRRARIALLSEYIDVVGVIAHRKRGTTYPAVERLQREEAAYSAELTRIEEMAREATPANPKAALDTYLAETYGDENEGDDPA